MSERTAYRVSVGVLVVLLLGSGICYLQRMLFVDPAFITLEVIVTDSLFIMERRYGAFVTHLVPLLCSRIGVPLSGLLFLYSISFYVFYLVVALVVGRVWKQYSLVTLFTLYLTLMVSDGYFWPNNEIHQAVAWMVLFLGRYFSRRDKVLYWYDDLLLIPLLFLAANTHLLVAAPLAFLWVYLHLAHATAARELVSGRVLLYTALLAAAIGLRYWMSVDTGYDSGKLSALGSFDPKRAWAAFRSEHAGTLIYHLRTNYWVLLPVVLAGIFGVVYSRKWWLLLPAVGAAVGYFVLVCSVFTSGYGREYLFYFESEWQPLTLILATPFVVNFLPLLSNRRVVAGVILLVFSIRLAYIADSYTYFDTRLRNLEVLNASVREFGKEKALVIPAQALAPYFGMSWGLPVETYFRSLLAGDDRPVTVKNSEVAKDDGGGYYFFSPFRQIPPDELPPRYFPIYQDVEYQILTEAEVAEITSRLRPLPK